MSDAYPLLRSLDPYHARIGYLGALSLVATRGLDHQEALLARFHDLLYERIYPEDPAHSVLLARVVDDERRRDLIDRKRPIDEDPTAAFTEATQAEPEPVPTDWLLDGKPKRPKPRLVRSEWLYSSEFWLFDAAMPSPLGLLPKDKMERTLQLARWTGILLPTLELSEHGYLIKHLLTVAAKRLGVQGSLFNPLLADAHPCLPLLYFRILLQHEMLLPFLILELVERPPERLVTRTKDGLLRGAVSRMLATIGEVKDPECVNDLRSLTDFEKSISTKDSTQENYLRPRLEILVDLGLLARRQARDGKRADFMWVVTDRTRDLAREIRGLAAPTNLIPDFLDHKCFAAWNRIEKGARVHVADDLTRLWWFAKAFKEIGREFGFTPGRTLALKACLMAWEAGFIMEVAEVSGAAYSASKTRWEQYLRYSGGSRFDSEFLIRVDDAMLPELERAREKARPPS